MDFATESSNSFTKWNVLLHWNVLSFITFYAFVTCLQLLLFTFYSDLERRVPFFFFLSILRNGLGLTGGSAVRESACNAGDTGDSGSIPGSRRCPGGGNGNPLWYSCLEDSMDRSLAGYSPKDHRELDTTEHWVPRNGFLFLGAHLEVPSEVW